MEGNVVVRPGNAFLAILAMFLVRETLPVRLETCFQAVQLCFLPLKVT